MSTPDASETPAMPKALQEHVNYHQLVADLCELLKSIPAFQQLKLDHNLTEHLLLLAIAKYPTWDRATVKKAAAEVLMKAFQLSPEEIAICAKQMEYTLDREVVKPAKSLLAKVRKFFLGKSVKKS